MDKIHNLYSEFIANVMQIDKLIETIKTLEEASDLDGLETMYENEFRAYMEHISIYDDLINAIEAEPETFDNKFELRRIKTELAKMLRVGVIEVKI